MKIKIAPLILLILLTAHTFAGELISTESKESTAEDVPLSFELEKTTWENGKVRIWGTVKNNGKGKYKSVKVILTAKSQNDEFIGRKTWYAEPSEIGPGQVGYLEDEFVECEDRRPAIIEYSVIGKEIQ